MASGFFAILDDIAMLADDTAVIAKVAVKKTAGILGDDLAVNAEKAQGFSASRELPVLWEITKGSFKNKIIILPIILLLSYFLPLFITPILILGGIYLSYEGAEKVLEYVLGVNHEKREIVISEKEKIRSAILTDFILSIEIIVIALSSVTGQHIGIQIFVVSITAFFATIGVYGIVGIIVRLDDNGLKLIEAARVLKDNGKRIWRPLNALGWILVSSMPWIIKSLSIIGTIAMLLVAGGIFLHNIQMEENMIPSFIIEFMFALNVGLIVMSLKKLFIDFKYFVKKKT